MTYNEVIRILFCFVNRSYILRIVGIIPVRGGSKGIPRKNIKMLAGKPLVAYTNEAAIKSTLIDKVIVSTEDDAIAMISKKYGAEIIKRPHELAMDETKTAPVIDHAIVQLEKSGYSPDIIVLLQATCPLRDETIIDAALNQLISSNKDSIFTGLLIGCSMPVWKKSLSGEFIPFYDYHLRPRRQDEHLREKTYCENGALYAVTREAFEKTKDFLGEKVDCFVMEHLVDIDTLEDFNTVEKIIIERNFNSKNSYNSSVNT